MGTDLNRFYVYVLFRPSGVPCYVGKGQGKRILRHERVGPRHTNKHLARIIAKAGGSIPKVKVREGLSESEAFETEKALIAAIGRGKNGPLVNLTDGGEGASGLVQSPESRRRTVEGAKAAMTGKPKSEAHRAALRRVKSEKPGFLGKRHSEATKEKMRAARLLQGPVTDATREKMRAAWTKRISPERNAQGQFS